MSKPSKKILLYIFLFSILIFLFYTRINNLQYRIPFSFDQIQFSNQIWDIVKNRDIVLLGMRVNNDLGFFLAPYFTYLLIPFYLLTALHPGALLIFAILSFILTFGLMLFTFTRLWSYQHALIVLALWSINYHTQLNDVSPWTPALIPIGSVLTLFFIKVIFEKPDKYFTWILFGLIQGLFFHIHVQYLLIVGFSLISLFLIGKEKKLSRKYIGIFLISFIMTFFPLLIFDLRHDFLNAKLFIGFFFTSSSASKNYFSLLPVLTNFFHPYLIIKNDILTLVFLALSIPTSWYLYKNSIGYKKIIYLASMLTIVLTFLFFGYYGRRPSEYYFLFLLPLFLMIISEITVRFNQQVLLAVLMMILLISNFPTYETNVKINPTSLYFMDRVVNFLEKNQGKSGYRISYSDDNLASSFNYLFRQKGFIFSQTAQDKSFVHISSPPDKKLMTKILGNYGVYISADLIR